MNKFFKFLSWIKAVFNPPYELTLADKTVNKKTGETIYLFKQYQSHECFKLTFNDIVKNPSIMNTINPLTLMEMKLHEHVAQNERDKFHVTEGLRNNEYKVANSNLEEVRSGSYICSNLDIYSNFNVHDLCSIAHTTGFKEGRDISKKLEEVVACHEEDELLLNKYENVVVLNKAK